MATKDPEKRRAAQARYRQSESYRRSQDRYRQRKADTIRVRDIDRKARKRWNTMMVLIERQGGMCGICGEPLAPGPEPKDIRRIHIDHVLAKSMGGSDDLDNLQATHEYCNESKGNRLSYGNGQYGQRFGR